MRLLLVAPLVLAVGASGSSAADLSPVGDMPVINPNPDSGRCPPISRYEAMKRGDHQEMPRLLNELPAADLYKAVYRKVGGCVAPIIVGYGFGAAPAKPRR